MDTMSALDSAFLQIEDRHSALHIGSVGVFAGPAPRFEDVRADVAAKLPRVPRYRQRMLRVPGNLGRPVWHDDPEFDLDYHLRRTALPSPGGDDELQHLVGRIMSRPLDPDRPLWEDWVVEGLADGRWAMVTKVHHSMVDGIAGTDLLTTMFGPDAGPVAPAGEAAEPPAALPGRFALVNQALRADAAELVRAAGATPAVLRHPRRLAATAVTSAGGLLRYLGVARPVHRSSLLGPLGTARRYRWATVPLGDVLGIRSAYGCTVNDVVLAAVTVAFRALLLQREEMPTPHSVRTLVPVSVRRPEEHGRLDNRVSAILVELPVHEPDVMLVLATVAQRMRDLKASHEAEAGELVTALGNEVPPPALAAGLRLAFRVPQQFVTTVTTNVPGPRAELRMCGRPMIAAYPYVPIADRVRIGLAVTSYGGNLCFGITADRRSTPDVDVLRDSLVDAFAQLGTYVA